MLRELLDGDSVVCGQRMIVRRDHDELFFEQELGVDVGVTNRQRQHGEIELAAVQLGEQRRRGGIDDHHSNPRIVGGHRLEQRRHQPASGRADHTDAGDAFDFAVHGGHVGDQGLELDLHAPGAADHDLALGRERAAGPVDEGDTELLFEAGHVGRDVRLDRVQRPGGRRERAMVGHRDEGTQLTKVHRQT